MHRVRVAGRGGDPAVRARKAAPAAARAERAWRSAPLRRLGVFLHRLRSCSLRKRLRRRIDFGVTSTSSSSSMNSSACSSVSSIGGVEHDVLVLAGGADVGQLLRLERVDRQVVVAAVDADDHALVDRDRRADEQAAAVLQVEQRVGDRLAVVLRDQHAVAAPGIVALPRAVLVEHVAEDARCRASGS